MVNRKFVFKQENGAFEHTRAGESVLGSVCSCVRSSRDLQRTYFSNIYDSEMCTQDSPAVLVWSPETTAKTRFAVLHGIT